MFEITEYQPGIHEVKIFQLWSDVFGKTWPLDLQTFRFVTLKDFELTIYKHFVAKISGSPVGIVVTRQSNTIGSIVLLIVAPRHSRKGIGSALLTRALQHLKGSGICKVQLGGGSSAYFWPGVPADFTMALDFFKGRGWDFLEDSYDLVLDLIEYKSQKLDLPNITISSPMDSDIDSLLSFEAEYFPNWTSAFRYTCRKGHLADILIAKSLDGKIVGSLSLFCATPGEYSNGTVWRASLGENMGGFGAVGVRPNMRERGIGLALSDRATQILKEQGVGKSFVGWTWLVDWYGKLGYEIWREYKMSWLEI